MYARSLRLMGAMLGLFVSGIAGAAESPAPRPFRLCVLDQAAIVQRSRVALNMAQRFQQVRQQAQAKLDDDQRTLDADMRALDGLRASIPAAVAKTRDAEIAQRRLQLKARRDQTNRDLAALDGQLTANVGKISDPMIRAVETEHACSMLIGKGSIIHLDDGSLDITSAIVEQMNAVPPPSQQSTR